MTKVVGSVVGSWAVFAKKDLLTNLSSSNVFSFSSEEESESDSFADMSGKEVWG